MFSTIADGREECQSRRPIIHQKLVPSRIIGGLGADALAGMLSIDVAVKSFGEIVFQLVFVRKLWSLLISWCCAENNMKMVCQNGIFRRRPDSFATHFLMIES